jgi:hypothetical protein
MNRTLCVCLTAALVAVGAGCTGGKEFTRPTADSVELGKTTMTQIRDRVGKPRRELNTVKEGVQTKTLTYAFSEATPFVEKVPTRAMSFHFWDGVLVGYDFLSSFDEDKTNFDDSRVSEIKKGETTEAQVVALFGPRGGKYIYPMVKERGKTAFVYQYVRMDRNVWRGGLKQSANKRLHITFDAAGKVDDIFVSAMERT